MKTKLTKKEWRAFENLLGKANNSDLNVMRGDVEKEIRLSETAIEEGCEVEE